MTLENVAQHPTREPFVPFHLHLSSGKVLSVSTAGVAHAFRHTLMVFKTLRVKSPLEGYYEIQYRHIERIEQLSLSRSA